MMDLSTSLHPSSPGFLSLHYFSSLVTFPYIISPLHSFPSGTLYSSPFLSFSDLTVHFLVSFPLFLLCFALFLPSPFIIFLSPPLIYSLSCLYFSSPPFLFSSLHLLLSFPFPISPHPSLFPFITLCFLSLFLFSFPSLTSLVCPIPPPHITSHLLSLCLKINISAVRWITIIP